MASFRLLCNPWQARVRHLGHSNKAKSFASRQDDHLWVRAVEVAIDRSLIIRTHRGPDIGFSFESVSHQPRQVSKKISKLEKYLNFF
jgi:hypothetical protein